MSDAHALTLELFEAAKAGDIDQARSLVAAGADALMPCAPVDVFVLNPGISMKIANGCAAAQAIKQPEMLAAILPDRIKTIPIVTRAASIWGVVCAEGEDVCLAQWAIEAGSVHGMAEIVKRLDRTSEEANRSLARLLRACARGCHTNEISDAVYASLLFLLASRVDLRDDWRDLETVVLREPMGISDGVWQYDNVPLTFSLVRQSAEGVEMASMALEWLLQARPTLASIGLAPPSGWNLLHWASARGGLKHIQLALDAGCDPLAQSSAGSTPIEIAMSHDKADCVALMQSWCSAREISRIRQHAATRKPGQTLTEEAL